MKRLAIITLLTFAIMQTQVFAATNSANNKKAAVKPVAVKSKVTTNNGQAYPTSGSDYLWKYNIDDLEAAPWLHSGKRVYK